MSSYGFTKAHVLEYYRRMSRFILPHLKDRAQKEESGLAETNLTQEGVIKGFTEPR